MPRRRRNDPAGVSDIPKVVTDPVRVEKGVAELRRRLTYLEQSYSLEKQLGLDMRGFNESLSRLKRAVARPRKIDAPETRLNPWLELAINIRARKLAGLEPDVPLLADHDCFVQQAAREVAERATALRGNPGDFRWNRFGPMFAGDIRRQRVGRMKGFRHWRWHLDEMYVKIGGERR